MFSRFSRLYRINQNIICTTKTGETWSIFNVLNQNWAGFSLEFHVQYDLAVRLYRSAQQQSLKRFVFKNSAWSSMIQTLQYIILPTLCLLYRSADWIGMLTVTSAMIPLKLLTAFFYIVYSKCILEFPIVKIVFEIFY